jgi:sortase (surface protein transpeptidase)
MSRDAGREAAGARAWRPGRTAHLALAALLVLSGGTAVAVGVLGQDADPPAPTRAQEAPRVPGPQAAVPSVTTAPQAAAPTAPAPLPVAVRIPAINVESELITVGLAADGTLEVPQPGPDYDKAAWYEGSPRPGEVGPAVLEGHVDSAENGPSVFYRLGALAVGDTVDVTRADGSVVTFVVDAVERYPKDEFPTLDVYRNTSGPELRLITCGGEFDEAASSYEDNTVVYASRYG